MVRWYHHHNDEGIGDMVTLMGTQTGWCGTPEHPSTDHTQRGSCIAFVSDAENTEALLREARLHDARARCDVEARYVREHRPY